MQKKYTYKAFAAIAIVLLLLPLAPVEAFFGGPSASDFIKDIEERYHINPDSVRDAAENFNVGREKEGAPNISVFFSPPDPRTGEELKAQAAPQNFSNVSGLFYTWYLQRANCEKEKNVTGEKAVSCDLNEDGDVDVEDWKIDATREIFDRAFDASRLDPDGNGIYNFPGRDTPPLEITIPKDDQDGYNARYGGDLVPRTNDYCYIHDWEEGISYELAEGTETNFNCPEGTDPSCVEEQELQCDENNEFEDDGGAIRDNIDNVNTIVCTDIGETPYCDPDTEEADLGTPRCGNGTPRCMPRDADNETPSCGSGGSGSSSLCSSLGSAMPTNCTTTKATPGGNTEADNLCTHLFAQPGDSQGGFKTGDGIYTLSEEEYWRSDPNDSDSVGYGVYDEASVVGLKISEFYWNYIPGDRVGVVAEGLSSSSPAKHDDASLKVMFAMLKNKCKVTGKGSYTKQIKGYPVIIPTASMGAESPEEMREELNDCLEDNMEDPREGNRPDKIDLNLEYYPENPINDETGDGLGDIVTVSATPGNTSQSLTNLFYDWDVEYSSNGLPNPESWIAIDEEDFQFNGPLQGNGNTAIGIRFNLEGALKDKYFLSDSTPDITYFRVRVNVAERFDTSLSRAGRSSVLIKVYSTDKKITAYAVDVLEDADGNTTLTLGDRICNESLESRTICFVGEHEIIGLQIEDDDLRNFNWKLNDRPLPCDSSISPLCSDAEQSNVAFFPVTQTEDNRYTVTVQANDVSTELTDENIGTTVELASTFIVVEPFVEIVSNDRSSVWPKFLGDYVDLNGVTYPDFSIEAFETFPGNNVTLNVLAYPSFASTGNDFYWTVNGLPVYPDDVRDEVEGPHAIDVALSSDTRQVEFFANQEVTTVSVSTDYDQPREIRKALHQLWGITQFVSTSRKMSSSVRINQVDPEDEIFAGGAGAFFASVITNTPQYILFLLRILITVGLMLFLAWIVSWVANIAPVPERIRR